MELGIFSEEEIESGLKHKVPFIDNDIEISNSQSIRLNDKKWKEIRNSFIKRLNEKIKEQTKTVTEEIYGTVVKVYEYPMNDTTSKGTWILMQPDNLEIPAIAKALGNAKSKTFEIVQRIGDVTYSWTKF